MLSMSECDGLCKHYQNKLRCAAHLRAQCVCWRVDNRCVKAINQSISQSITAAIFVF